MIPDAAAAPRTRHSTALTWAAALAPAALLALFLLAVTHTNPAAPLLRNRAGVPNQYLSIQRVLVKPDGFVATVMNESAEPATIAQVIVDNAFWQFSAQGSLRLAPLGSVTLTIPYPWVPGENHRVDVMTSTGARFGLDVRAEAAMPEPDARQAMVFTTIGLVVGLIPVAIGLCWMPLASRFRASGREALGAFAIGVVIFLLVEAVRDGVRSSHMIASAYQGLALFVMGVAGAFVGLAALAVWLRRYQGRRTGRTQQHPWTIATTLAVGIGLFNLTQGVALGTNLAMGENALRTMTLIGLALHNVCEGMAIISPLGGARVRPAPFVALIVLAGAPAILGLWLGGLLWSTPFSVFLVGLGAGALAQVVPGMSRHIAASGLVFERFATVRVLLCVLAGLTTMYGAGVLTA